MIDNEVFESYINACKMAKIPFVITLSNYSQKIESELINYNSLNEEKSKMFFSASSKVKEDCLKSPIPLIDKKEISYFNFDIKEDVKLEKMYGIDLKNAYATMLRKFEYISGDTFYYLSKLEKLDRLGSLGMLAGKKKKIYFDKNGKYYKSEVIKKQTENYFFFAIIQVAYIMNECKKLIKKNDYLFTWVDCIYFQNEENFDALCSFLEDNGIEFHKKYYEKFETKKVNENTLKVTMYEKEKLKLFHAPTKRKKVLEELSKIIEEKFF